MKRCTISVAKNPMVAANEPLLLTHLITIPRSRRDLIGFPRADRNCYPPQLWPDEFKNWVYDRPFGWESTLSSAYLYLLEEDAILFAMEHI